MKIKNIFNIGILTLPILLTNCVKDEKFVEEVLPTSTVTLKINEIFSNGSAEPDWFEIYNPTNSNVDMSGFSAYDKIDAKYTFPNGTIIPSKGYLVLVCNPDSAMLDATKYATFKLSSAGESLTLLDKNSNVIDQLDFPAIDSDKSWGRTTDGSTNFSSMDPTRNASNGAEEIILLNEIQGSGAPDYIELYNPTTINIDITGYTLQDPDTADVFTFPTGTTIIAKGFLVLKCSGTENIANLESDFKISSLGEDITLKNSAGVIIDQLLGVNWPAGHTALIGREFDGSENWVILTTPSEGTTNNS